MRAHGTFLLGLALLAAGPALAQPPATPPASDNVSIWTIQAENDSASTYFINRSSDRYYTSGLRIGWTSPPSLVPASLKELGHTLWGAGEARVSVDLTHQMYTPSATFLPVPPLDDRPYASVLMGYFGLVQDTPRTRSTLVLGLGVVGPGAVGERVQNGFHELIGQRTLSGWRTQLRNEPLLQIISERTWRVPIYSLGPFETDALPSLTAAVGNLRTYVQTGVMVRLGQGLQSDFGPARLRPGTTGGDYFSRLRPVAWYVFAGADGRAVAHDLTLDGNTFNSSRSVSKHPFVGQMQAGIAVMALGVRFSYTHRLATQEFRGQRGGLHQVGSFALSVRF